MTPHDALGCVLGGLEERAGGGRNDLLGGGEAAAVAQRDDLSVNGLPLAQALPQRPRGGPVRFAREQGGEVVNLPARELILARDGRLRRLVQPFVIVEPGPQHTLLATFDFEQRDLDLLGALQFSRTFHDRFDVRFDSRRTPDRHAAGQHGQEQKSAETRVQPLANRPAIRVHAASPPIDPIPSKPARRSSRVELNRGAVGREPSKTRGAKYVVLSVSIGETSPLR